MASASPSAASNPNQSLAAIDRIRDTAKWLLTTFGVVGAALVAGTQLSDIGDAEGWRLALAFGGAVLGFLGVALAIWMTGRVFMPQRVGLEEITSDANVGKWASEDPGLLKGQADTVDELVRRYRETLKAYGEARREAQNAPTDQALKSAVAAKQAEYQSVENPTQLIRGMAIFDRVNSTFRDALIAVGIGIALAGVGLLLFAYATGSASNENEGEAASSAVSAASASFLTPAAVTVVPTQEGKAVLADILGKDCDPAKADALLLGQSEGNIEIASPAVGKCRAARFIIQADLVALKAPAAVNRP